MTWQDLQDLTPASDVAEQLTENGFCVSACSNGEVRGALPSLSFPSSSPAHP